MLPPLNITKHNVDEALKLFEKGFKKGVEMLKRKDLISLDVMSKNEIDEILELSLEIKKRQSTCV